MKFKIQYLVILLLLVLFPLISWLYLKNGISFRKQALNQLSSVTSFNNNILDSTTVSRFAGKIALIEIDGAKESLDKINDQFKESSDFVILTSKCGYKVQLGNNEISNLKAEFPDRSYILIDNEGKVRRTYMDNRDNEMKQLVIHIATLIPFVEKKKPRGIK
jgi:hypothetical protein